MAVPVIGLCAYSGVGKTTLLVKLLPVLRGLGMRVGVVKHTHHQFEVDHPGKDSYELRKAGASEMLVASGRRWALMVDTDGEGDPVLQDMLDRLDRSSLDLIVVEGFRHEHFPKVELYRPGLGRPPIFPHDPWVVAVATDDPDTLDTDLPLLDINRPEDFAAFIVGRFPVLSERAAGLPGV